MSMKKLPEGFPLKPIDSNGHEIREGDKVRVISIPDWLTKNLDEDSVTDIKNCEGAEMHAYEIDDYESHSFSMEPRNLLKI